jgi:hypothetical protein
MRTPSSSQHRLLARGSEERKGSARTPPNLELVKVGEVDGGVEPGLAGEVPGHGRIVGKAKE